MGFFRRKKLTPDMQKIYDQEHGKAVRDIRQHQHSDMAKRVRELAKGDAERASRTHGQRIIGAMDRVRTVTREVGKRIDKLDMEKFEASITGVKPKKRK